MTKYINKLTGSESDYDKVHDDFEYSLVWDGTTDPEEFLIDAYEDEFEDWQGIRVYDEPRSIKNKLSLINSFFECTER